MHAYWACQCLLDGTTRKQLISTSLLTFIMLTAPSKKELVIGGLLLLALAHPAVRYEASKLWRYCGLLITDSYGYIYDICGGNFFILFDICTYLVTLAASFLGNSIFFFLDVTGRPKFLQKYKIQERKHSQDQEQQLIPWEKYKDCLKVALINAMLVTLSTILSMTPIFYWNELPIGKEELPTFPQFVLLFFIFIAVEETAFYYIHRLLHKPPFYVWIHKMHHEWVSPISISQYYCHPVEHFFLNCFVLALGPALLGRHCGNHVIVAWIWYFLIIIASANVHSGYHLPFTNSSEEHDFHHSRFNQNYGTVGLLDYLHGTSSSFRCSKEFQRHFMIFGIKSAKEIVPDQ